MHSLISHMTSHPLLQQASSLLPRPFIYFLSLNMPADTIYIRAKRQHSTIFVQIKLKDTIGNLKQTLSEALGNTVAPTDIRLSIEVAHKPGGYTVLDDHIVVDKVLTNEAIVFMTYRKNDKWEDVDVAQPESLNSYDEEEEESALEEKQEKGKAKA